MFDCLSEQLASLVEIVAGVQHALDLCAVLRPLFDLVKSCDRPRAAGCRFPRRTIEAWQSRARESRSLTIRVP